MDGIKRYFEFEAFKKREKLPAMPLPMKPNSQLRGYQFYISFSPDDTEYALQNYRFKKADIIVVSYPKTDLDTLFE